VAVFPRDLRELTREAIDEGLIVVPKENLPGPLNQGRSSSGRKGK